MTEPRPAEKVDQDLSLEQQIAYLRRFGEAWPLTAVAGVCAVLAMASVYAFTWSDHERLNVLLLFVAGVSGLLAIAISTQLPGLKRAARATRTGRRLESSIKLTVDRSDSENVAITGEIRQGRTTWKLHFGRPLGWNPQSGEWPCELIMLSDEAVPALVQLPQGLLLPTGRSHRVLGGGA